MPMPETRSRLPAVVVRCRGAAAAPASIAPQLLLAVAVVVAVVGDPQVAPPGPIPVAEQHRQRAPAGREGDRRRVAVAGRIRADELVVVRTRRSACPSSSSDEVVAEGERRQRRVALPRGAERRRPRVAPVEAQRLVGPLEPAVAEAAQEHVLADAQHDQVRVGRRRRCRAGTRRSRRSGRSTGSGWAVNAQRAADRALVAEQRRGLGAAGEVQVRHGVAVAVEGGHAAADEEGELAVVAVRRCRPRRASSTKRGGSRAAAGPWRDRAETPRREDRRQERPTPSRTTAAASATRAARLRRPPAGDAFVLAIPRIVGGALDRDPRRPPTMTVRPPRSGGVRSSRGPFRGGRSEMVWGRSGESGRRRPVARGVPLSSPGSWRPALRWSAAKPPSRTSSTAATRDDLGGRSVARVWDEQLLALIRQVVPAPTCTRGTCSTCRSAMWDAWAAYDADGRRLPRRREGGGERRGRPRARRRSATPPTGVLHALRYASSPTWRRATEELDATMASLCYRPDFTDDRWRLAGGARQPDRGRGDRVRARRRRARGRALLDDPPMPPSTSRSIVAEPGTIMADPNRWQPLALEEQISQNGLPIPGQVQTFIGPHWGHVTSFALPASETGHADRPGPAAAPRRRRDGRRLQGRRRSRSSAAAASSTPRDGVTIDIGPGALGGNTLGANDGDGHDRQPGHGPAVRAERGAARPTSRGSWPSTGPTGRSPRRRRATGT